jgi:hypothetical protein
MSYEKEASNSNSCVQVKGVLRQSQGCACKRVYATRRDTWSARAWDAGRHMGVLAGRLVNETRE